jgi:hypothetical protein
LGLHHWSAPPAADSTNPRHRASAPISPLSDPRQFLSTIQLAGGAIRFLTFQQTTREASCSHESRWLEIDCRDGSKGEAALMGPNSSGQGGRAMEGCIDSARRQNGGGSGSAVIDRQQFILYRGYSLSGLNWAGQAAPWSARPSLQAYPRRVAPEGVAGHMPGRSRPCLVAAVSGAAGREPRQLCIGCRWVECAAAWEGAAGLLRRLPLRCETRPR